MEQPINVADMYTSHQRCLEWQPSFTPAEQRIERLKGLLAEVDGRSAKTPQARWARGELLAEIKRAQKHLQAITNAAKSVEPFRVAMRTALAELKAAEAACDAVHETGDAQALVVARVDRELKGEALMVARKAFGDAITAAATAHVGESQLDFTPPVDADPNWSTRLLTVKASLVDRYQPGYYNYPIDRARRMGREADRAQMIKWITEETQYLGDPDCVKVFAERWLVYSQRNGIALEQATAAE